MDARSDLANVVQALPAQPVGQLAPAPMPPAHVPPAHRPVGPIIAQQLAHTPQVGRREPPPLTDPLSWSLAKHVALLAVVATALLVALRAQEAPIVALAYAATSLFGVLSFVVADRARFLAAYGPPGSVDVTVIRTDRVPMSVRGYGPVPDVHVTQVAPPAVRPAPMPFRVTVT